jgi:hypothetical protein
VGVAGESGLVSGAPSVSRGGVDANTLSALIREASDSGGLRVVTKSSTVQATGVHASALAGVH